MRLFRSSKSRFIALFIFFVVVLCMILCGMAIWQTIKVASDIFAAEGMVLVNKALSLIDGDSFESLAKSLDEKDPFYEATRLKLLELKELSSCRYLYSMAPAEGNIWRFIIDGSVPPEDTRNFSPLGVEEDASEYESAFLNVWTTKKPGYGSIEYFEEYGWILSIYTPIWNSAGEAVGIVGCDFGAEGLFRAIWLNAIGQIIVVLIFMAAGIVLVTIFVQALFKRFTSISNNLDHIMGEVAGAEEDLARWIRVRCKEDEIKDLAFFFKTTMDKLRKQILASREQVMNVFGVNNKASSK